MLTAFIRKLKNKGNQKKAESLASYFKTGKGEYGEGDIFLGVSVPDLRKIAKKYLNLSLHELQTLLKSRIHEHRFSALEILRAKYKGGNEVEKREIFHFYIRNATHVNNWDLVDTSAPYILGDYLLNREKKILCEFARSRNLWKRRIAIISTHAFIREGQFDDTLALATILLGDKHDLIHKAVGWMLREIGSRSLKTEELFLRKYAHRMPRTMLRYATERFPRQKRMKYLSKR